MTDQDHMYMYKPGSTTAQTIIRNGVCIYTGKTTAEMQADDPALVVMTPEEGVAAIEEVFNSMIELPKPITGEYFDEMFSCLPPLRWTRSGSTQFFFLQELLTGHLTTCYAKTPEGCFAWTESMFATNAVVLEKINHVCKLHTQSEGVTN